MLILSVIEKPAADTPGQPKLNLLKEKVIEHFLSHLNDKCHVMAGGRMDTVCCPSITELKKDKLM